MLPRTPLGWLTALLVTAGVLALMRLGFWQLDRHAWKQGQRAEAQARHDLPPLGPEALALPGAEINFRRVRLEGRFDADRYVLVAGRYRGGVAGYHLVQALELDGQGSSPLVDRGWIPREGYEARVAALGGPAEVTGLALESAPFDAEAPRSQDGLRWTQLAPAAMASALEVDPPGWFLTAGEPRAEGAPEASGEPPFTGYSIDLEGRPHLEYAGTWFLLAATLALGSLGAAAARRR